MVDWHFGCQQRLFSKQVFWQLASATEKKPQNINALCCQKIKLWERLNRHGCHESCNVNFKQGSLFGLESRASLNLRQHEDSPEQCLQVADTQIISK